MKTMLLAVVLLSLIAFTHGEFKRVCYYTNWAQYRPEPMQFVPEDIDVFLCTHFIYAFAWMEGNALTTYEWNDEDMYLRFNNHIHQINPNAKTLLAVGGWTFNVSELMTPMLATKENRTEFIDQTISFLRDRQFDGFDLDFEYPGSRGSPPEDKYKFTLLVQELRAAYDQEGIDTGREPLLLTAAVAIGKETIDAAYEIDKISVELDFINLMAYDLGGAWLPYTSHNSPLYERSDQFGENATLNVAWGANYWVEGGCPPEKLVIGLAMYGRGFNLTYISQTDVGAPADGECRPGEFTLTGGFMAFYEICDNIETGAATYVYDEEHEAPYTYQNYTWIGFESVRSIRVKVRWIINQGYGGFMIWAVDLDDFKGTQCSDYGGQTYPLINAAIDELNEAPTSTTIPRTTVPTTSSTISYVPTTTTVGGSVCGFGTSCGEEPSGRYPDPENCYSYYQCSSGIPTLVPCSSGLIYDPSRSKCDYAYNVNQEYVCCKCPEMNADHPDGPC